MQAGLLRTSEIGCKQRKFHTRQPCRNDAANMAWQLANDPSPMRPPAIPAFMKWVEDAAALINPWIKIIWLQQVVRDRWGVKTWQRMKPFMQVKISIILPFTSG